MRLVPLIAAIAGCSAPAAQKPLAERVEPATESLWDKGTFVTIADNREDPNIEEHFEIYRRADGYRINVTWKRPSPTGEPSDGEVTLFTDEHFSPVQGQMVTTLHLTSRTDVTRSSIQREPDGRLSTEVIAADGSKEAAHSSGPNHWFIGGTITTFVVPLCEASAAITAPIVYPDKQTNLAAFQPLLIAGAHRSVTSRTLEYNESHRKVIVACENGKLAGESVKGTSIVRKGDLDLARALEQQFR